MILWFMGSSSVSGSVLTAESLESALDSVSLPLSAPRPLTLSFSKIKKLKKKKKSPGGKKESHGGAILNPLGRKDLCEQVTFELESGWKKKMAM